LAADCPYILEGFQQFIRFTSINYLIEPLLSNGRYVRANFVIVKVFYLLLLYVTIEFRLSLHPFWMLGIRG